MAKWNVVLSTTEPYNYIGIINVRQGNRNSEVMEAVLTENSKPMNLSQCKVFIEALLGNKYAVERAAKIIDAKNGRIQYTFDEYTMQMIHEQTANFKIVKGEDVIATTQDFSYFVVRAVSKTEGEMGSYWQTVEDLIADMTDYINKGKGDFDQWMKDRKEEFEAWRDAQQGDYLNWFESIKDILKSIDPGGVMLSELMDARVDLQGVRHESIKERLIADLEYIYKKIKYQLDLIVYKHIPVGNKITIEHDSEYQPEVRTTFYQNAIGTETDGLDTSDQFGGGTIYNVPTQLSFDRKKTHVEMPLYYALNTGDYIVHDKHTLLIIEGNKTLCFTMGSANITKAYINDGQTEVVRIPENLELFIKDDSTVELKWKRGMLNGN
nr:MAG TPA: distal tail protein [Caudoviricetes sp.]